MTSIKQRKVGELRPSQIMFTYGVGAIVDLPYLSVIVMGLDDWPADPGLAREISEERLLRTVHWQLGPRVQKLLSPPVIPASAGFPNPFDESARIGVFNRDGHRERVVSLGSVPQDSKLRTVVLALGDLARETGEPVKSDDVEAPKEAEPIAEGTSPPGEETQPEPVSDVAQPEPKSETAIWASPPRRSSTWTS